MHWSPRYCGCRRIGDIAIANSVPVYELLNAPDPDGMKT